MGELWIADISHFDLPDGRLPRGQNARKARFLGEIVSAASLMAVGEFQVSSVSCRRRPNRRRCPGQIRLGRDPETDEIHWVCPVCSDRGVITNWRDTRWDLSLELKKGHIISLSEERVRRAGRATSTHPLQIYELDVDLVYAPVVLEEQVTRRIRIAGCKTLHDLHRIIHLAFDRVDEEAYEFMFGPPYDPETRRFTGASQQEEQQEDVPFEAESIRIDTIGLKPGDAFGYLFDFSDEWVHRVTVRSVKERKGQEVSPQVVSRMGDSPPQLPAVEEAWDDDLFWDDVETTYPLTGLYGPYLVEEGVDAQDWLGLDELERHLLVLEAHAQALPSGHASEPTLLHAVVHVLAESRLAELGQRKAKSVLESYHEEDGSRHQAIHRMGEELIRQRLGTLVPSPRRGSKRKPRSTGQ